MSIPRCAVEQKVERALAVGKRVVVEPEPQWNANLVVQILLPLQSFFGLLRVPRRQRTVRIFLVEEVDDGRRVLHDGSIIDKDGKAACRRQFPSGNQVWAGQQVFANVRKTFVVERPACLLAEMRKLELIQRNHFCTLTPE